MLDSGLTNIGFTATVAARNSSVPWQCTLWVDTPHSLEVV